MNTLQQLKQLGQSVWYDNIQRNLLGQAGELARMIAEHGLAGVTSNPSIFEKAINNSQDYDAQLSSLVKQHPGINSRDLFFALAIDDIQNAADLLLPVYQQTQTHDGYVSLEVSPDLAYDTDATIAEAKRLAQQVNRPNLMIKVPGTREGIDAVEALTAAGISVNATLLFSAQRYEEIARAYIRGLRQRQQQGLPVEGIASVASFFVSRVDTLIDGLLSQKTANATTKQLEIINQLTGQVAILNAKSAYAIYQTLYGEEFADLAAQGGQPQRLLWASSGTKNPVYSDVLYIDSLIGADTVNTMPPATYQAFLDHGKPTETLTQGMLGAAGQLEMLAELDIDLAAACQQLEDEGVQAFAKAFNTLLAAIEQKAV